MIIEKIKLKSRKTQNAPDFILVHFELVKLKKNRMTDYSSNEMYECRSELALDQTFYAYGCFASIAFTVLVYLMRIICLKDLLGAPSLAMRFYIISGLCKIGMAICLLTVLRPSCRQGCTAYCESSIKTSPIHFYPFAALYIGIRWLYEANRCYQRTQDIHGTDEDGGGDMVFSSIPTDVEMAESDK
jgi:hypothetical protein